jgi:hypothetical protein
MKFRYFSKKNCENFEIFFLYKSQVILLFFWVKFCQKFIMKKLKKNSTVTAIPTGYFKNHNKPPFFYESLFHDSCGGVLLVGIPDHILLTLI